MAKRQLTIAGTDDQERNSEIEDALQAVRDARARQKANSKRDSDEVAQCEARARTLLMDNERARYVLELGDRDLIATLDLPEPTLKLKEVMHAESD